MEQINIQGSSLPSESPISLSLVKAHLRVDHNSEDDYILLLRDAAVRYAEHFLGYEIPLEPEKDIVQALLLIIGHWYANREEVVTGTTPTRIPFAADALLWANRTVPM